MTSIDFYTHVADRLAVAGKLVAKALALHGHVRVLTQDATATEALDRLLWLQPATGFLPHCRIGRYISSPDACSSARLRTSPTTPTTRRSPQARIH